MRTAACTPLQNASAFTNLAKLNRLYSAPQGRIAGRSRRLDGLVMALDRSPPDRRGDGASDGAGYDKRAHQANGRARSQNGGYDRLGAEVACQLRKATLSACNAQRKANNVWGQRAEWENSLDAQREACAARDCFCFYCQPRIVGDVPACHW
jgi:hypothetical protein